MRVGIEAIDTSAIGFLFQPGESASLLSYGSSFCHTVDGFGIQIGGF